MDKYEEIKSVGKGSFGDVYLVRRKKDDRQFVLKKMSIGKTEKEKEATTLEIQLLQKLEHPGVVEYVESFQLPKSSILCIIMAFCDGGDLDNFLKKKRSIKLTEKEILDYLVQMLLALHFMHDRNILHRDLKTQNVFLKNGFLKLGDFGISKVLDSSMDFAQTCIGTPYYMSPELFKNKPYNFKTDVWSLGCILYELATYKHAFDSNSLSGLAQKIIRGSYPPISPNYSKNLRDLLASMLSVNPNDRPSMEDILKKPFIKARVEVFAQTLFRNNNDLKSNLINPSNALSHELENLKKQLKSIGWDDILNSLNSPPTPAIAVEISKDVLRQKVNDQRSKLEEEEQQKNNLELALQRLRDESKWRVQQRSDQASRVVKVNPSNPPSISSTPRSTPSNPSSANNSVNGNIAKIGSKVDQKLEPPKPDIKKVGVEKSPRAIPEKKEVAVIKQVAAVVQLASQRKPVVPIAQPIKKIASSVDLKKQSDDRRKKEDEKRVTDLDDWENDKRKKLNDERERAAARVYAQNESDRKAMHERKKENKDYAKKIDDRMNKEQEELLNIRRQREALQNKLEMIEIEKKNLQFASMNDRVPDVKARSGIHKLPDAFNVKKITSPVSTTDNLSAKDKVLMEKEMRKKQEEEKRIKELEAARNDYVSHRANADERNKALYVESNARKVPIVTPKSRQELEVEALDKFPGDSENENTYEFEADEDITELANQLEAYTMNVDQLRRSLCETEYELALEEEDVPEDIEEIDEAQYDDDNFEEDPELVVSLAERFNKLKEYCVNGLGLSRFNIAYDRFKKLREKEEVQDDVSEIDLLTEILGTEDALQFFKPLDQLYFIESNFM